MLTEPSSFSADPTDDAAAIDGRRQVAACPICRSRRLHYAFSRHGNRVVRCEDCRLMLLNPQPSDAELTEIYGARYFLGAEGQETHDGTSEMKAATARRYLQLLSRYRGAAGGALLEIGCGRGELLAEAERAGYDVTGVEIAPSAAQAARARLRGGAVVCGDVASAGLEPSSFDVCVLSDVIEHVRDPLAFLRTVHGLLRPEGTLFIATPSLDSWSARLLRQNWMEFKPEHLTYFDRNTLQNALHQADFRRTTVLPGWKVLNLDYVARHFTRFPVPLFTRLVVMAAGLLPRWVREKHMAVVASGMIAMTRAVPAEPRHKLSVIVPAFNEAATFELLLQSLLRKRIEGMDIEVIVVESNSTDGTRQIAQRYAGHALLQLVLEERPRGKGHAVRAGLARATGDFILIQDADLEYDLEDYDVLLEPLRQGREAFVLGSRHGGHAWWKMRQFADQRLLATLCNAGHWFFTTALNMLFLQRLRDPFTMFKVFRRDCLYGLNFTCDRFDFDFELLIKLLRKGYHPVEIPVNYRSRSYREGKKVSFLRDPLTWLRALARFRLQGIDPLREIERIHASGDYSEARSRPSQAA